MRSLVCFRHAPHGATRPVAVALPDARRLTSPAYGQREPLPGPVAPCGAGSE